MFSSHVMTCSFLGAWDSEYRAPPRGRISRLLPQILARAATVQEQRRRVQAEVLRHRVAWPKFWLGWWAQTPGHPANREASPLRRIGWRVGAGWGRHGESGSEADGRASGRVGAGWETRSESGSDVGGDQSSQSSMDSEMWRQGLEDSVPPAAPLPVSGNHGQVQLPHPADLIRQQAPSLLVPCRGCGEHSCDQYPACVRAMFADLLGQPPCKFWRAE